MSGGTEDETYRGTMQARTLDGAISTVIVTREAGRSRLTLGSAARFTVVLNDRQVGELVDLLLASGGGRVSGR